HPPNGDRLCMQIDAGRLTIVTRLISGPVDGQERRTDFELSGLMADPDVNVTVVITANETTTITQVAGAMYCWYLSVANGALPLGAGQMSNAERGAFVQSVHLRMTLAPSQQAA